MHLLHGNSLLRLGKNNPTPIFYWSSDQSTTPFWGCPGRRHGLRVEDHPVRYEQLMVVFLVTIHTEQTLSDVSLLVVTIGYDGY